MQMIKHLMDAKLIEIMQNGNQMGNKHISCSELLRGILGKWQANRWNTIEIEFICMLTGKRLPGNADAPSPVEEAPAAVAPLQ